MNISAFIRVNENQSAESQETKSWAFKTKLHCVKSPDLPKDGLSLYKPSLNLLITQTQFPTLTMQNMSSLFSLRDHLSTLQHAFTQGGLGPG